jgi:hypothetical protein
MSGGVRSQGNATTQVLKIRCVQLSRSKPMNLTCTAFEMRSRHVRIAAFLPVLLLLFVCAGPSPAQTTAVIPDGWVVLPVDEYRALRRAAFPLDTEPAPPPVEATLTRIDYDLKVEGDLASGEARLTVDVIRDGWVRLAMPRGLMVREASLDGRQVTLVAPAADKGPGAGDLLLSKTGRSVLTLKIVAPVSSVAGTDLLQLPASNSAVVRAVVEVARQGVDVKITGGLLMSNADTAVGSRWIANGRGTEPLTFAWRRRIDEAKSLQPLRFRGTVSQLVGLGEDSTQINAEIQIDVLQGTAQEVRLQLPDQFIVNQVSGATVTDWETKPGELIVVFIEPVQQSARFTLSGELRLPRAGKLDVPLIRLPAAERETGGVAVEVLGAGEIKERLANGLEEAEAAELGELISSRQSPSLVAFRFPPAEGKSTRSLSLGVARYTPQAVLTANIEEANYSAMVTTDGKMLVQTRFAVRNNQRNFLKLNLPASATLWSASVAGRPVRPGRASDGSLLLPLEKMKSGDDAAAFVVEISYIDRTSSWADRGRMRLSLVAVDLPISKSHLLLHHSPTFRLTPAPGLTGSFRIAPYSAPASGALRTDGRITNNEPTAPVPGDPAVSEGTRQLVSKLRDSKRGSTPMRNLPLRVAFPHFGPSLFLVSELTSENQTPVIELDFQRDKKRGDK